MIDKKWLLLDIDNTLFDEEVPRPYLKEFIDFVKEKYEITFYTAGSRMRVVDVLRIMIHQLNIIDQETAKKIQRRSLTRENCPMINYRKEIGWTVEIKCLSKAAEMLKIDKSLIILIDDAPNYDHPDKDQIIQAEGFLSYDLETDDYLLRLINILKSVEK